jgi:hypothetical protein
MLRVGEAAQDLLRIVSDDRYLDPMLLESGARLFQLNELAAAVGSPIGAAAEDQQQAIGAREVAKALSIAVLIGQREVGNFLADVETAGGAVILRLDELAELCRRYLLSREHLLHHVVEDVRFAGFRHRRLLGAKHAYPLREENSRQYREANPENPPCTEIFNGTLQQYTAFNTSEGVEDEP